MNTNIWRDFQICISESLITNMKFLVRSFKNFFVMSTYASSRKLFCKCKYSVSEHCTNLIITVIGHQAPENRAKLKRQSAFNPKWILAINQFCKKFQGPQCPSDFANYQNASKIARKMARRLNINYIGANFLLQIFYILILIIYSDHTFGFVSCLS